MITGVRRYLNAKIQDVRKYYPDWEYIEIGIESDHIHSHMIKYSVSDVVETIKKNTSQALKEKFSFLKKVYWD